VTWIGVALLFAGVVADDSWPQFRGPTGLGYSDEKDLPLTWGGKNDENVLWKAALTGRGHSSPIVWRDRVFVTGVWWPPGNKPNPEVLPEHRVTCYRASDGKRLWDATVPPGPWLRKDFRSGDGGGYAAPTPVTDGERVYVVFGSSVAAALDFAGAVVWRKEIVPYTFDVTIGSSPVLFRDTVLLLCATAVAKDARLVAFDARTGETRWERKLNVGFAHSTPVLIGVNGRPQLVLCASGGRSRPEGIQGLDPASGRPLWWCTGPGEASSPAFGAGLLYCDGGRGGPGVAVDPTGEGDVTGTHLRWTVPQVPEGFASPIIVGDYLFRHHAPDVLKCWNVRTGEPAFAERLPGVSARSSPIADAQGRLYFASGGRSFVLRAGPKLEVLATNDLGDRGDATAAAAGGKIFIKGGTTLFCVGRRKAP
jgi:outer membrane protein assembly factor BamB